MPMGVAFCGNCGTRIPEVPSPEDPDAARAGAGEAPAPRNTGVRMLVAAWALGIVAGFFLGHAFTPSTPAQKESADAGSPSQSEGQDASKGPMAGVQPESAPELLASAHAASDEGRYAEARDLYLRVLDLDPANLSALVDLGIAELALGDEAAGRSSFSGALAGSTPHPAAAYNLGRLAENGGNREEAGKYYALYLKLAPQGPRAKEVREKLAARGEAR
jgi:tetratricopeptide (TPR) repeat protein